MKISRQNGVLSRLLHDEPRTLDPDSLKYTIPVHTQSNLLPYLKLYRFQTMKVRFLDSLRSFVPLQ